MNILVNSLVSLALFPFLLPDGFRLSGLSESPVKTHLGANVTLMCRTDETFGNCSWLHLGDVCDFVYASFSNTVEKERCSQDFQSRVSYTGNYEANECAITVFDVTDTDAGNWRCEMEELSIGRDRPGAPRARIMLTSVNVEIVSKEELKESDPVRIIEAPPEGKQERWNQSSASVLSPIATTVAMQALLYVVLSQ